MVHTKTSTTVGVCATCPWRLANQGKPHTAGWYRITNLRRIWNGIRTGKAPGFVCHSTDTESAEYGSTKPVPSSARKQECGGMLIIVGRHLDELAQPGLSMAEYKLRHDLPMTKAGIAHWAWRLLTGPVFNPPVPDVVCEKPEEVGLPWDRREVSRG